MEQKPESAEKKQLFRSHPPLFDVPHPYLAIMHGRDFQRVTFYNLSEGRYYTRIIPELRRKLIHDGGGNGWIYVEDGNFGADSCSLLNLVTMEKVKLPPLLEGTSVINERCIISSPPSDPDCRVMLYQNNYVFTCKPGDENFIKLDLIGVVEEGIDYIAMFQGRIYGMSRHRLSTLVVSELDEPDRFKEVELEEEDSEVNFQSISRSYLMESCGDLLRVHSYSINNKEDYLHFKVFLADFSKMKWVRLDSIGNRAILIDFNEGWSCSTAGLEGMEGNTIYFTYENDRNMQSYNLDDDSISIYLPCPIVASKGCMLKWILMPSATKL